VGRYNLPMVEKNKLINKVKHLVNKARLPRYLHHFGPKTYELWQHIFGLFIKEFCRLSYRRTVKFMRDLGLKVATKSTLQRYAYKLRLPVWTKIFQPTIGKPTKTCALDGTGLERTNASWHYIKRIDAKRPRLGYKLSILTDMKNKILALRIRSKAAHDIKDVKYLLKRAKPPKILLMDKGYDAEWLHQYCHEKGIRSIAPTRKGISRGHHRKKLKKCFPQKIYNKRSYVESTIHALKQKFGPTISSKNIHTARTQIYIRTILHNIYLKTILVLGHTRVNSLFYVFSLLLVWIEFLEHVFQIV
jgi:hypothetical protein